MHSISKTYENKDSSILIKVNDVFLNLPTSILLELIINELVTFSIEYTFSNNKKGTVSIIIYKTEINRFEQILEEDGVRFKNTSIKNRFIWVRINKSFSQTIQRAC